MCGNASTQLVSMMAETDRQTKKLSSPTNKINKPNLNALRVSDVSVDPNQQCIVQKQLKLSDTNWTTVGFS